MNPESRRAGWTVRASIAAAFAGAQAGCGAPSADSPPAQSESVSSVSAEGDTSADLFLEAGTVRLHYLDYGGEGDLLLFIPGVTGTAHIFNGIGPAFTDSYRVIAMTRRGHGDSELPDEPIDLDMLADDIAKVIDQFTDRPAIVAGHSYGGLELPRLARRHPSKVRALVFLDAVYDWPELLGEFGGPPGFTQPDSVYDAFDGLEAWLREETPELWSDVARALYRGMTYEGDDGRVRMHIPIPSDRLMRFVGLYEGWSGAEYEAIEVPVLSIQADQSGFYAGNLRRRGFAAEDIEKARGWGRDVDMAWKRAGRAMLEAAVPHAVSVVMDSTHHNLLLQRPDDVVELLREFLDERLEGLRRD